jgi:hypothetical protein
MERVQIKGIEELTKEEKYQLNKIVNDYYDKIKRSLKNDFTLQIKIKAYQKTGKGKIEKNSNKKKKYSIQAMIHTATKKLESNASDWDLNRTMHAVLKKILEEIEHVFHASNQKE